MKCLATSVVFDAANEDLLKSLMLTGQNFVCWELIRRWLGKWHQQYVILQSAGNSTEPRL